MSDQRKFRSEFHGKKFEVDGRTFTVYAVVPTGVFAFEGDVMEVNDMGEVVKPRYFDYAVVERGLLKPGRPVIGETRKVSLTLPSEIWCYVDDLVADGQKVSAVLRSLVESGFGVIRGLAEIQKEYESIVGSEISSYEKDKKLAGLMTEMEREFCIPMFQDKKWEEQNKGVIAMYRKLSMSRETI